MSDVAYRTADVGGFTVLYRESGAADMPSCDDFDCMFEHLADVIDRFIDVLGLGSFALYVFDYGVPVGFRIAA